ncbi:MAG: hypothetical protein JWL88_558 [Parcubacteria group bacterium]|nr:hypothetical protein [Parcubacteria group bacterium]
MDKFSPLQLQLAFNRIPALRYACRMNEGGSFFVAMHSVTPLRTRIEDDGCLLGVTPSNVKTVLSRRVIIILCASGYDAAVSLAAHITFRSKNAAWHRLIEKNIGRVALGRRKIPDYKLHRRTHVR